MTPIKAVIFDLDDTLIYSGIDYKQMKNSLIEFLTEVRVDPSLINVNMLNSEILRAAVENLRGKNVSEKKIRKILDKANAIMNESELNSLDRVKLMEGALEVLSTLKRRGFKLGVITNGCRNYAVKVVEKFHLNKYVEAIVARDDVADFKPSSRHLSRILEVLGVSAEEAVFVGDHWIDALCAKNSGVRFILFRSNRSNAKDSENMAHKVIDDLRELVHLLPA